MAPRNAKAEVGQKRSYTVPGATGPVTSVTTFLKAYPKEALAPWAAKMVAERAVNEADELRLRRDRDGDPDAITWLKAAPWESRDASAEHGTGVHDYLERRMRGGDDPPATPGEVAVSQWIDVYRPRPIHVEAQIANLVAPPYAGSLDLIAEVYGRVGLIDLKTSGGIYAETRLQLAAYRYGEFIFEDDRTMPVPVVDFCAVLWVPKDRPEQWQFVEVESGQAEYETFRKLQAIYQFSQQKSIGGELILPQKVSEK